MDKSNKKNKKHEVKPEIKAYNEPSPYDLFQENKLGFREKGDEVNKNLMEKNFNDSKIKKEISPIIQKPQPIPSQTNEKVVDLGMLEKYMKDKETKFKNDTGISCRFLNSDKCHKDFPNFSGASIKLDKNSSLTCDGVGDLSRAEGVCTISNGKIKNCYIIDGGKGYNTVPNIEIKGGGGKGLKLKAVLDKKTQKITDINVLSEGSGYYETPEIVIDHPSLNSACYLCCK